MADTTNLQTITQPRKERRRDPIGGAFETFGDIFETITGAGQGYTNEGPGSARDLENLISPAEFKTRFPTSGEIADFQKARTAEKSDAELLMEQRSAVTEAMNLVRQSRAQFVVNEEVRLEVAGMSEEERNKRLNLNSNLRKEHTENAYHMAELYRQVKAENRQINQQEQDIPIPSPAKQASALETQFEGGSGKIGSGTGSLSSASGAVG